MADLVITIQEIITNIIFFIDNNYIALLVKPFIYKDIIKIKVYKLTIIL